MSRSADISVLIDQLSGRAPGVRYLLGICGPPGAAKSTIARRIADELGADAVVVPMDGFHLASSVIRGTPLETRRGAPDTFDAAGFVALLRRLRDQQDAVVYAPRYEREIEEPIACSIPIAAEIPVVIVEGNYLLHADAPWSLVPGILDQTWYVEQADDDERIARLIDRHVRYGKSRADAIRFVHESDERNARLIAATRPRADLVVTEYPDGRLGIARP